jgi:formylglycine-generating enzyme required for sulfatase activity
VQSCEWDILREADLPRAGLLIEENGVSIGLEGPGALSIVTFVVVACCQGAYARLSPSVVPAPELIWDSDSRLPSCTSQVRLPADAAAESVGLKWAPVPSGSFEMGCAPVDPNCEDDERPRHVVHLTQSFEVLTTEVTVRAFRAYSRATGTASRGRWEAPGFDYTERHPVAAVSWDDARLFCEWIGGRLPTEAEWEYAASGGQAGRLYPWGNDPPSCGAGLLRGAWFADCDDVHGPRPVGSFGSNGYGLYDTAGNVFEWVGDWYGPYDRHVQKDPTGPKGGSFRVLRGGSWNGLANLLRLSDRNRLAPATQLFSNGFRCARSSPRLPTQQSRLDQNPRGLLPAFLDRPQKK